MKNVFRWLLIFVITLVLCHNYFQAGIPLTHDGENHLARFANYKIALREGQFPPRWAPNLLNRFGYPVFNFNYPLANIVSVPFSILNIPYPITFKLIMGAAVIVGGWGCLWWLRQMGYQGGALYMGVCVAMLSPYVLSALLFRGSIGEVMAWALLPWLFMGVEEIHRGAHTGIFIYRYIFIATAFLLAHNVTAVFALPLLVLYAVTRWKTHRIKWWQLLRSWALAIAASLWFWLPALVEKSATILDQAAASQDYTHHFVTVSQLLFSPLTFGYSWQGSVDSLSFAIGGVQLITFVLLPLIYIKLYVHKMLPSSSETYLVAVVWGIVAVLLGLQLEVSTPIWQVVTELRFIQFPWRLGVFVSMLLAPLAAFVWNHSTTGLKTSLVLLCLGQLILFMRVSPLSYVQKSEIEYDLFAESTSTAHENLPKTFDLMAAQNWQPAPQIAQGQGTVTVQQWSGSHRQYHLSLTKDSEIVEPTAYFLGWEVTIASPTTSGQWDSQPMLGGYQGKIAYALPAGEYEVRSQFTQHTWPRLVGNAISSITVILVIMSLAVRMRLRR